MDQARRRLCLTGFASRTEQIRVCHANIIATLSGLRRFDAACCRAGASLRVGASPGCWARFGEVLAREYSNPAYAGVHRITVDAYAAQHPGKPSPRSIQSVAVHLLGLYWALEKQLPLAEVAQRIGWAVRAGKRYRHFRWLDPPFPLGDVTVLEVAEAHTPEQHAAHMRKWANAVWLAWAPHHNQIRNWAAVSEIWK